MSDSKKNITYFAILSTIAGRAAAVEIEIVWIDCVVGGSVHTGSTVQARDIVAASDWVLKEQHFISNFFSTSEYKWKEAIILSVSTASTYCKIRKI